MFNLLSGEFYKVRKSGSFYVCCIILVSFLLLIYGAFKLADAGEQENMENNPVQVVNTVESGSDSSDAGILILDVEQVMIRIILGIVTAVFASIFVIGEYGNGAIKNITGKGYSREKIYLAKYLITIIAIIIMFIITVIATLLCGIIFYGMDGINAEFFKELCQYAGIQLLLETAFIGVVVAIDEISRSKGVAVAVSLGLVMASDLVFVAIDAFLLYIKVDFRTSKYWITRLISECPVSGIDNEFVMRVIGSVVFWTIAALAAGLIHFKKADVK